MKALRVFILLVCVGSSLCLTANNSTKLERPKEECVQTNASLNYFPTPFQMSGTKGLNNNTANVTVARDFSVAYFNNYKVVTNSKANETYVLYQCGVPKPAVGDPGVVAGAKFFEIPLISVVVADTVPLGFLEALNVTKRVNSVSKYSVSPCGQKLLACNRTAPTIDVGGANASTLAAALASTRGDAIIMTGPSNFSNSISFDASSDPGALNRAEWIKFLALFFNKDNQTNFAQVNASYHALKAPALNSGFSPVVAFIQKFSYLMQGDSYQISFAPTSWTTSSTREARASTRLLCCKSRAPSCRAITQWFCPGVTPATSRRRLKRPQPSPRFSSKWTS
eukprot:jgi/Botrbrau1/4069/Bobra.152_3s0025.2